MTFPKTNATSVIFSLLAFLIGPMAAAHAQATSVTPDVMRQILQIAGWEGLRERTLDGKIMFSARHPEIGNTGVVHSLSMQLIDCDAAQNCRSIFAFANLGAKTNGERKWAGVMARRMSDASFFANAKDRPGVVRPKVTASKSGAQVVLSTTVAGGNYRSGDDLVADVQTMTGAAIDIATRMEAYR